MSKLAEWLWRSSQLEGYAAGVAAKLAKGPLITLDERAYVGDVIHAEELQHRDVLASMARSFGQELPPQLDVPNLHNYSDLDALMLLTRGEGALLLEIRKFRRILDAGTNAEFLRHFDKIVKDELGHRQWSRTVVFRLHNEGHEIPTHVLAQFQPFWAVRDLVDATQAELGLVHAASSRM